MHTAAAGSKDLGAQVRKAHGGQSGRRAWGGRSELQSGRCAAADEDNVPERAMEIAEGDGFESGGAMGGSRWAWTSPLRCGLRLSSLARPSAQIGASATGSCTEMEASTRVRAICHHMQTTMTSTAAQHGRLAK
jgi:hypothetical protein